MTTSGPTSSRDLHKAFTLLELLVVIGILVLLMALLLAVVGRTRQSARSVQCMSNLREIWGGFHAYTMNHGGRFPDPWAARQPWERMLGEYLETSDIFRCPADGELFETIGSSYDWRDTGRRESTLAGRPLPQARPTAVLAFDSLPGWHRSGYMNVVRVDGSAASVPQAEALGDLMSPAGR